MSELSKPREGVKKILPIIILVLAAFLSSTLIIILASKLFAQPRTTIEFSLRLNATRIEVDENKVVNVLITLVPQNPLPSNVTLEIDEPEGICCNVSRRVLNYSSNNAILTINTTGVVPGSYQIRIWGSCLDVRRSARLMLLIKKAEKPWFGVDAKVFPDAINQTGIFFINISIIPHAGFNDDIEVVLNDLPGSWLGKGIMERGINKTTISVYTSRETPARLNNFTLVLKSAYYTVSINLTIRVLKLPPPSFQISFLPNITIVKPWDTVNLLVSVKPLYGFDGNVRIYSSHVGINLEKFNGSSFILTPKNYSRAIISMRIDKKATCGLYSLSFCAEAPSIGESKIITISLGVANVSYKFKDPFPGIAILPRVEAKQGQEISIRVLVGSINGFGGEVIPSVTQPQIGTFYFFTGEGYPEIGLPIERVNIASGEAKFLSLRITIRSDAPRGVYKIKVMLCREYIPPNMFEPALETLSVYTIELHII